MAYNGSGTFVRLFSWATDKTNTVPVTASRMDSEMDGFATGLSTAITKDGQTTATARIPFAAGLSAMAGSVSSVSYGQTNDNNTGVYFPASDEWGISAGGTATLLSTATTLTCPVAYNVTGAVALSSTLAVTGNFAINTNKFTVTAASGNTLVAGTLDVTGAVGITGNVAVNTNKFNVTAASGNTAVAGTLAVTGATTLAALSVAAITGSSTIAGTNITASGALSGATAAGSMIASQAEQETGSATDKVVTPGRQHFHPGSAKAWAIFAPNGALLASYNVASITDVAPGIWNVAFTTSLSSAEYAVNITTTGTAALLTRAVNLATTGFTAVSTDSAGTAADPSSRICVTVFGDI